MSTRIVISTLIIGSLIASVAAHSWITCVNYTAGDPLTQTVYNQSLCGMVARGEATDNANYIAAYDNGPSTGVACQYPKTTATTQISTFYGTTNTTGIPHMKVGDNLYVTWSHGHTGGNSTIYVCCNNATDPSYTNFTTCTKGADVSFDQCSSNGAVCGLTMKVSAAWVGQCTMMWNWNGLGQQYTSCFDAVIASASTNGNSATTAAPVLALIVALLSILGLILV